MNRLLPFLSLILLSSNSVLSGPIGSSDPPPNSDVCKGKSDGVLLPDKTNPHDFFECNNGVAFRFHCPTGLIFGTNGCVVDPALPTKSIDCITTSKFDCKGKADGFYSDPTDRKKFHGCDHGCPTDFVCPPKTYFEPSKSVCAFDSNPDPVTQATTASGPPHTHAHTTVTTVQPTTPTETHEVTTARPSTTTEMHDFTLSTTAATTHVSDQPETTTRGRHF